MSSRSSANLQPGEEQLHQVIADYIRALENGDVPDRRAILSRYPDIAGDLRSFFRQRDHLEQICSPLRTASRRTLNVRCPHCFKTIELADHAQVSDLSCPSCGSHFSLVESNRPAWLREGNARIGQFQLLKEVGVGQFGSVWKAWDVTLERTVAIKLPRCGQLTGADAELFLRDARLAAQLKHPNIVSVHELGRHEETIYIVSDFIEGETLKDRAAASRMTFREAATVGTKIAMALHHAHDYGVIHRDLKPGNVMMDAHGEPHIVDFGLAKRDTGEITLTIDGQILGTPAYMSPEQARGEGNRVDRRADIYSFGVLLYELLTGELPFRGYKQMLLIQILQDDPPNPRKLNSLIPRDLETICLKCLEKEPDKRYQTARECAEELERYLRDEPIHASPVTRVGRTWRWCRRNRRIAILSALVLGMLMTAAIVSPLVALHENRLRRDREAALTAERHATASARETTLRSLINANTADVHEVLVGLDWRGNEMYALLVDKLSDQSISDKQRLHVHLALLPRSKDSLTYLGNRLSSVRCGPKETWTICQEFLRVVEPPILQQQVRELWTKALDPDNPNTLRFQTLAALATIDPESSHWEGVARDIALQLVTEPLDQVPDWLRLLEPVSSVLRSPLEDVFRNPASPAERVIATSALAVLLGRDADPMIELIKMAGPDELTELLPKLELQPGEALDRLRVELNRNMATEFVNPEPKDWIAPPDLMEELKSAGGFLASRFAIVQHLPIEDYHSFAERLRAGGYQPTRARPFQLQDKVVVAALWLRNSKTVWSVEVSQSESDVLRQLAGNRGTPLWLVDLAAYRQGNEWRYLSIWSDEQEPAPETEIVFAAPVTAWQQEFNKYVALRFCPMTTQVFADNRQDLFRTQIWIKPAKRSFRQSRARLEATDPLWLKYVPGMLPVDLSIYPTSARSPAYSVIWHRDESLEYQIRPNSNPEIFIEQCQKLDEMGCQPASISSGEFMPTGNRITASIWHRPIPTEEARQRESRAKANIAVALLHLGAGNEILPLLDDSTSQLRTDVICRVGESHADMQGLIRMLVDPGLSPLQYQAILLSLSNSSIRSLTRSEQADVQARVLELHTEHSDSGVHSAAGRLLRDWWGEAFVPVVPPADVPKAPQDWYTDQSGQDFSTLPFAGRSPTVPTDRRHDSQDGRIAIATTEVTDEEFRRFRPRVEKEQLGSPDGKRPVGAVSWYDAVAYCHWLNIQHAIPESEWCYLPDEHGKFSAELTIPRDFYLRTGYRLPTIREWKFAASATSQDKFFFGHDVDLLGEFAWTAENANDGPQAVGRLLPNRYGLFDIYGNIAEWCHDSALDATRTERGANTTDVELATSPSAAKALLGGHYRLVRWQVHQEGMQEDVQADAKPAHAGFRVARTLVCPSSELVYMADQAGREGDLPSAISLMRRVVDRLPDDWFYRSVLARLQLHRGDVVGYRQECNQLVADFKKPEYWNANRPTSEVARMGHSAVLIFCASPELVDDWSDIVRMAEFIQDGSTPQFRRSFAMALFRAGRLDEAAAAFSEVRAADSGPGLVITLLFQAMIHARQQQPDEAGRHFDLAIQERQSQLAAGTTVREMSWRDQLFLDVLTDEVRQVLRLAD